MKSNKRNITILVLLVFSIGAFSGLLTSFQKKVILPPSENYIEASQEKALKAFVVISVVKGLVAVVEGSDVAGVEVGDIVQPLYDAIDITWKLIAISLTTLYAIGILIKLCGLFGSTFFGIACVLYAIALLTKRESLKKYIYFFCLLAFLFFIGIPSALYLAGKISNEYSSEIQNEFDTEMDSFQTMFGMKVEELKAADFIDVHTSALQFIPDYSGNFNIAGAPIPNSFHINWPSIDSVSSEKYMVIQQILLDMEELIEKLPEVLFKTGVSWFLDVVVIPLGMFFLLYKLAILFLNSFIDVAKADKFEKVVSGIIEKHFKKS